MRYFLCLAAAGALASMSTAAVAQPLQEQAEAKDQSSNEDADKEEPKADKKKICKRIQSMGSRFSKKVCMTKAQWDAQRKGAQDAVREGR